MGKWEGIIIINNKEIKVTVNYITQSPSRLGEWSGYGYVESITDIDLESYDTNIGNVLISELSYSNNYFEFKGSGKPIGSLAIAMEL